MGRILLVIFTFYVSFFHAQTTNDRVFAQQLCSPAFHGRGYVNKGDSIAAAFIAQSFKSVGLKPIKKTYFQSFTHTVNTFPGNCLFADDQRTLTPGIHYLVDPSSGGGKMNLRPTELPITVLLDKKKIQQEVIQLLATKKFNSLSINTKGYSADTVNQLNQLAQFLAEVLPVITVTDKKLTWSVSNQQLAYPLIQLHDSVYRNASNYSLDLDALLMRNYTSRNVVGWIKAKKKTTKTVVFTAHYDHLGRMGNDTYFPGANDNASGTTMLYSLASYFSENRPDVNVVFIAFAGEEAGLLGSKYFTEHPLIPLKNIQFVVNLDIMGSGEDGITAVNATLHPEAFSALTDLNQKGNYLKAIKSRGPAANSDHYWFTQHKVPAFFLYTMGTNKNYHDVFDSYDKLTFSTFNSLKELLISFSTSYLFRL